MVFQSLHDLLTMGGHGPYVWGAYTVGLLVLLWNVIQPVMQQRTVTQDILRNTRREKLRGESINSNKKES